MNAKQKTFCEEYIIDLNATQAAIRAGYSEKTAANIGHENLRKPEIAAYIAELQQKRSQAVKVTAEDVLRETWETYQEAREEKSYSAASSLLKLAAQHVDVQALLDRKEQTITHKLEELPDDALDAKIEEHENKG